MDGIFLIDKPSGWTSFDVVAKVRGIVRQATGVKKPKVGHTGTLDPLATGLMIVIVGAYCKRASEFSKLDKTYEVMCILGKTSTTGDAEGKITQVSDIRPSIHQIKSAIEDFIGNVEQVPPAYSAIKVSGQRAYKLARAGVAVKLEPRKVIIYNLDISGYSYPELCFTTMVSSGTYIRSLVEDIGTKLGTGAYMSGLRRTTVGEWTITEAKKIDDITKETISDYIQSS